MNICLGPMTPKDKNYGYSPFEGCYVFPHVYGGDTMRCHGTLEYRDNYWIWLKVEEEFGRYLRRLFLLGNGTKLQRPSNDSHITVASSHEVTDDYRVMYEYYKLLMPNGTKLPFTVDLNLWTNGNAYWYPVKSVAIEDFREKLGLPREREFSIHFAIGYLTQNENVVY